MKILCILGISCAITACGSYREDVNSRYASCIRNNEDEILKIASQCSYQDVYNNCYGKAARWVCEGK